MIPITLSDVARAIDATDVVGSGEQTIRRVAIDSREVSPGDLFVAIRGERLDGHRFVPDAVRRGALACICDHKGYAAHVQPECPGASDGIDRPVSPCHQNATILLVPDTIRALGELASFYRREAMPAATRVIAVTGTNGKTTAKGMIHHVLGVAMPGRASPKSFNNHIGVPLTLLSAEMQDRYLVVEIGTNAPGEVAELSAMASPDVGVITSVGEAHLEGLGSLDGVIAEKASLLKFIRASGLAVVNVDGPRIRPYLAKTSARDLVTIRTPVEGTDEDNEAEESPSVGAATGRRTSLTIEPVRCSLDASVFNLNGGPSALDHPGRGLQAGSDAFRGHPCPLYQWRRPHVRFAHRIELPFPGMHHAANAAVAFAIGRWFGLEIDVISSQLRTFQAMDGRARVIRSGGLTIIDDSYNANPASVRAAIATLRTAAGGRRILVLGDMLELGSAGRGLHADVLRSAVDAGIELICAVGPLACDASLEVAAQTGAPQFLPCADAASAVDALLPVLRNGDTLWIKGSRAMALERVVDGVVYGFRDGASAAVA